MAYLSPMNSPVANLVIPEASSVQPTVEPISHRSIAMTQAVEFQRLLFQLAISGQDVNDKAVQRLVKLSSAWGEIEDKRQVLAGIGKPKPVEARNTSTKSRRKGASFVPVPVVVSEPPILSSTVPVPVPEQATS